MKQSRLILAFVLALYTLQGYLLGSLSDWSDAWVWILAGTLVWAWLLASTWAGVGVRTRFNPWVVTVTWVVIWACSPVAWSVAPMVDHWFMWPPELLSVPLLQLFASALAASLALARENLYRTLPPKCFGNYGKPSRQDWLLGH